MLILLAHIFGILMKLHLKNGNHCHLGKWEKALHHIVIT
jgi:hypothetical protein